jgi:hypothetical protein
MAPWEQWHSLRNGANLLACAGVKGWQKADGLIATWWFVMSTLACLLYQPVTASVVVGFLVTQAPWLLL